MTTNHLGRPLSAAEERLIKGDTMATDFRSAMVEDITTARNRLSQLENRLNDSQGRPLTLTEQQDLTTVQERYDDLYRGVEAGGSPPPLRGETPDSYDSTCRAAPDLRVTEAARYRHGERRPGR